MSAGTLRAAAALMRERAEAAICPGIEDFWTAERREVVSPGGQVALAVDKVEAEHIASWHPAVALAVAAWLEDEATRADWGASHALTVARAYLGRSA